MGASVLVIGVVLLGTPASIRVAWCLTRKCNPEAESGDDSGTTGIFDYHFQLFRRASATFFLEILDVHREERPQ